MCSELISIIVPVFNCEKYLSSCVVSILNQTYRNFELILLNDGSTDGSEKLCREFANKDSRIVVYSHQNMGVSKTRHKGLDVSKGSFVTFVDSDDQLQSDFLETMYHEMKTNGADIVCCNSIDSGLKNNSITDRKHCMLWNEWLDDFFENKRHAFCIWAKLWRKQILYNIDFLDLKYAEDTMIVMQGVKNTSKIELIPYYGYNYTDNPNGAMNSSNGVQQARDVTILAKSIYEEINKSAATTKVHKNNFVTYYTKCMFNLITSTFKETQKEQETYRCYIKDNIDLIAKKNYLRTIKGLAILLYYYHPDIFSSLLRIKDKLKHIVKS